MPLEWFAPVSANFIAMLDTLLCDMPFGKIM